MPSRPTILTALRVCGLFALLAAALPAARASIVYSLDRPSAAPGETVTVKAVYFNEDSAGKLWNVPQTIVLQWRSADGAPIRTLARARGAGALNVPVNNFARFSWVATVPAQAHGILAVSIEGQPALMALDATRRDSGTPGTSPAITPVVDAGTGIAVPQAEVVAAGASPDAGPAPQQAVARLGSVPQTPFDRFRSSISEYKPVYFDVGTRGDVTARFQLSAKYRLFTPEDSAHPRFYENLYLGYTQISLWDLQGDSKPFIDTTFNPSAFWLSDNVWSSANQNWRLGFAGGVEHKSNGKAGPDSRSLNDGYVQPAVNYRFDGGSTLTFAPKLMSYVGVADENADYSKYNGHVEYNLRWAQDNGAVVSAMYKQGDAARRTTELDFAWPLQRTWLNMNGYVHLQYFNGYGETLLDYNRRGDSQFRIGLSLVP
jgi:outer membrane phospholipase A